MQSEKVKRMASAQLLQCGATNGAFPSARTPDGVACLRASRAAGSFLPLLALLAILASTGCTKDPTVNTIGPSAFRVRSDFTAPLNSDQGWARALNENVTVNADRPFRVRFEMERPPESTGIEQFRLQYRRNGGDWTDLEAHDFPHPVRELDLDFAQFEASTSPEGWKVAQGNAAGMAVAADGREKFLRTRADREPLVGLTHRLGK